MPMTESIQSIKEVELNQFIQAFDRIIQMPEVNRPALVKQLLLRLGQKNIREVLPMMSEFGQGNTVEGLDELRNRPPLEGQEQMEVPRV